MRKKADLLLKTMIDSGEIDSLPCGVDSSLLNPHVKEISNTITTRYDAGIQNRQAIGMCVIEGENMNDTIKLKHKNLDLQEMIDKGEMNTEETKGLDLYNHKAKNECPTLSLPNHNELAVYTNLRIRKFTPRECFRLMGLKDEDIDKLEGDAWMSDAVQYHLAGDSIVIPVLTNLIGKLY